MDSQIQSSNGGSASKKRKPNSTSIPTSITSSPVASTSNLNQNLIPSINVNVVVQPLSAVAARRAASLLLSASSSIVNTPLVSDQSEDDSESEDEEDEEEEILDSSRSGSEEQEEDLKIGKKIALKKAKKATSRNNKKELKKSNGGGGSRYFNGLDDNDEEMEIVIEPTVVIVKKDKGPKIKLGRGKRQREKRSAFLDPTCYSNFKPIWDQNAFKVSWLSSNGIDQVEGLLLCLETSGTLILHGTYNITPIFGSCSISGGILTSTSSTHSSTTLHLNLPPLPSNTQIVFAPSSHPLPIITSLQLPFSHSSTSSSTLNSNSNLVDSINLPDGRKIKIDFASTVILITDSNDSTTSSSNGIEGIETILKAGGLGCGNNMWGLDSDSTSTDTNTDTSSGYFGGRGWNLILQPTPSLTSSRTLNSWELALDSLVSSTTSYTSKDEIDIETEMEEVEDLNAGAERIVCLVEGPKRVGKSTFARQLLNRLLTKYEKVAYLDTDLGQPEFTPPGLVSLSVLSRPIFGPSFTHLSLPVASHFLGTLSPASDPSAYSLAISALLATYALEIEFPLVDDYQPRNRNISSTSSSSTSSSSSKTKIRDRIPLIINTQGWVKGLGADLLSKLKLEVNPTHLYHFEVPLEENQDSSSNGNNSSHWSNEVHPHNTYSELQPGQLLYTLEPAPSSPLDSKWSAADLRTLAFISYFHSNFSNSTSTSTSSSTSLNITPLNTFPTSWDFTIPLVAKSPYSLNWLDSSVLKSVHILQDEISYSNILHALNGSIVALLLPTNSINSMNIEGDGNKEEKYTTTFPFNNLISTPHPSSTNCLGLGIIRSIDPSTTSLHLLTPIPSPSSSSSNSSGLILIKGSLELPIPLMMDLPSNIIGSNTSSIGEPSGGGICGVEWKDVPFLTVEGSELGRNKVRRNLMRRGQQ